MTNMDHIMVHMGELGRVKRRAVPKKERHGSLFLYKPTKQPDQGHMAQTWIENDYYVAFEQMKLLEERVSESPGLTPPSLQLCKFDIVPLVRARPHCARLVRARRDSLCSDRYQCASLLYNFPLYTATTTNSLWTPAALCKNVKDVNVKMSFLCSATDTVVENTYST